MTLHEQITGADLGVFLDLDDFAEIHDVNGVKCRAVLQEISAEDLSGTHYEVYRDLMQVHCRARTCRRFPGTGRPSDWTGNCTSWTAVRKTWACSPFDWRRMTDDPCDFG